MSKSLVFRGKTTNYGGALDSISVAYFFKRNGKAASGIAVNGSMESYDVTHVGATIQTTQSDKNQFNSTIQSNDNDFNNNTFQNDDIELNVCTLRIIFNLLIQIL